MTLRAPMRCSALADDLAEPMAGTADHRVRWLLVEDRSAWGEKAVRDVLGHELEAAAKARGMRLLLIRRREGDPAADAVRRVMLVDTARRRMSVRTVTAVAEIADLLDLDVDDFGAALADAIFLVCTNGKRDACCALRGRGVMAALAAQHAERTWECSHLGGHRFAANLACLPHGLVYGRVAAGEASGVADAYLAGRTVPALLRGRSAWPAPAQVAEIVLRERLDVDGADAIDLRQIGEDGVAASVVLGVEGEEHRFRLVAEPAAPARPISCRADELETPIHWRVVG